MDRKTLERTLILEFIGWLDTNKPAPPGFEYVFTIHDRLSLTPTLALYIVEKGKPKEQSAGGLELKLPDQFDTVDGIRHIWNEVQQGSVDVRDYVKEQGLSQ